MSRTGSRGDRGGLWFGGTDVERARSVVFALFVATGFLAVVSATVTALTAIGYWPVSVVLAVLGLAHLAVGFLVARGRVPWLVRDFQAWV